MKVYDPNYPHLVYDKDENGDLFLNGDKIEVDEWVVGLVPYEEEDEK